MIYFLQYSPDGSVHSWGVFSGTPEDEAEFASLDGHIKVDFAPTVDSLSNYQVDTSAKTLTITTQSEAVK